MAPLRFAGMGTRTLPDHAINAAKSLFCDPAPLDIAVGYEDIVPASEAGYRHSGSIPSAHSGAQNQKAQRHTKCNDTATLENQNVTEGRISRWRRPKE